LKNNKILALSLLLILTTMMIVSFSPPVKAVGTGSWITTYSISDSTGQILVQYDPTTNTTNTLAPVLPGTDVVVTFTVNVIVPGSDTLKLSTNLQKSTSNPSGYWSLQTSTYDMGSTYNPAAQSTTFKWTVGTFDMVLYGKIPNSVSNVAQTVNVVILSAGAGGSPLDQITVQATSANLANFNVLYAQQETKLKGLISSGVAQGYIDIFTNVLNASRTIANAGDVNDATTLLNSLNASNAPVTSATETLFIPVMVVLAVVAVIFAVLFLRIRGKVSYFQLVVEDQIKDLEGLTLRISKIDRASSSSLESVKDRLKRLVGM
jgi:uncharacterized membrane protein YciS (DUF1049 family)